MVNRDNNGVEVFYTENEVLERVDELRAKGVSEDEIYVISEQPNNATAIKDRSRINYTSAQGSFGDKFSSFLSGQEPEARALSRFNLTEEEKDLYIAELKNGKFLLYTEADYADDTVVTDERTVGDTGVQDETYVERNSPTTGFGGTTGETDRPTGAADTNPTAGVTGNTGDTGRTTGRAGNADDLVEDVEHAERTRGTVEDDARFARDTDVTDTDRLTAAEKERMELHEEKVDVDKRRREAGEVEVNKRTVRDHEEFDVPVTREEVTVERRPVNEVREPGVDGKVDGVYEDKDSIRVPVHEEEVEVSKKDVVKEEIVVDKKEVEENVHVDEEVRREEADISDTTEEERLRNRRNDDRLDR